MSKHIHIHIEKARRAGKAKDAGFDESKIKRDAGGQFASKAGAGTETHHTKLAEGQALHDKTGRKIDEAGGMHVKSGK